MGYMIGIILAIIALIITGLILRKRVYDVVDKYESWKMDIMDRNIAGQLGRIKKLNLSGETQEKFESWKERWEYILTKELPDIEEHLFDAEEAADRYRFSKAKKTLNEVEQILQTIEKKIEVLLKEVDELVESEESSRKEIEEIEPEVKVLRKKISQNRYQYGKAEAYFESEIDRLDDQLVTYNQLVDSGDYLEAKQIADQLRIESENLQAQIDIFPELYKKCKQDLPAQLEDLISGLNEMKAGGYHIDSLELEKEIYTYQERLLNSVRALESGDTSGIEEVITDIEDRIKEIYDLLEEEAIAKNYLETKMPSYENSLNELNTTFLDTKEEVEQLRQAYHVEDSDMEKYLAIEKTIASLKNQLDEIWYDMQNTEAAHTALRKKVEDGFNQIESLQEKHDEFKIRIHNLRKDELEAKEKLVEIRDQLYDIRRKLKKSNIPGVPTFIWNLMETASAKNELVIKALEQQPLDMAKVQAALYESKLAVDHALEQTELVLEQAYLTEQVIQYANRYRSQYPILAGKLVEAERLFRSYEYELALEQAAKAVEEIEPGALKRIEANEAVGS
ncbi:septation ring formation regulator EzrA [Virgibacillus ainsalahensis]